MGIVAEHIGKAFGDPPARILSDISLSIEDGDFVSLTGRSGAGKSSLLYVISSLDSPTEGRVLIEGRDIAKMGSKELHAMRNTKVGFVFQFHYLIAELTVLENVLVPALKVREEKSRRSRAESLIAQFGLADKMHRYPRQLSGGEMQRVAIARALIMQPKYLFADEPTGSLDTINAEAVIEILRKCNSEEKTTVIMVTHDPDFAKMTRRQIRMADGRVVEDLLNSDPPSSEPVPPAAGTIRPKTDPLGSSQV
jgi:putative ABC transport system ATP-binding protein/lipoprotein-releasing system ATP-binding protein